MLEVAYLAWAKAHAATRYNLARSGILPVTYSELGLPADGLELFGHNSYGYEPLVRRIAQRYGMAPEQVVSVTGGTSMANYLVYLVLIQPGDEVLIEQPVYEPLVAVAQHRGAMLRYVPRRLAAGYRIDIETLTQRIGPRTRLIVLTNLHNPSGVRLSSEELQEVHHLADRYGARVLVDEAYLDLVYEDPPDSAIRRGGPFIVTSSLTKAYGLDGLRAGWVLCDAALAHALRRAQDFLGVVGVNIAERLAAHAWDRLPELAARSRRILAPNRARVDAFMAAHPRLTWVPPDAGMIAYPRLSMARARALCDHLRQHYETLLCPGHFFENDDHHFRLSFGMAADILEQGLENLGRALQDLDL